MAQVAESAGADALMLLPPFFLGPSQRDVIEHVTRIGEAVDVPIVLQYAPEQTGVRLSPETFRELAESVETVRYLKTES